MNRKTVQKHGNADNPSLEKSHTAANVNHPDKILTKRKLLSPTVLRIAASILLIIMAAVLISVLTVYFNHRNIWTSSNSTTTLASGTTSTGTTIPTISTSTSNTTAITNPLAILCKTTCLTISQAALSTYTAVWAFENDLNDLLNNYNGTGVNNPGYNIGYIGQALSLTGIQYVTTPFINFSYSSFTIEAWIQPYILQLGPSYAIFGECETTGATRANCMSLLLQTSPTYNLYMGFYIDDLAGSTNISSNFVYAWSHVAFVFDYSLKQQNIYLNGYSIGQATLSESSPGAYVGTSGLVNIGAQQTTNRFNGLIDQMFVTNRAKSACEILNDATLVAYFSFDSDSAEDNEPIYITGTATSGVRNVTGHINEALAFGSPDAYFYFGGLIALGITNQAFSISLWVQPFADTGGGTIVHVASQADGFGWCIAFIGFNDANQLTLQSYNGASFSLVGPRLTLNAWTHVVQTYSLANGLTLYVNGIQVGTTGSVSYSASGVPDYMFIGYYGPSGSGCTTSAVVQGVFSGAVDELRVYSRELTPSDVCVLANQ